MVKLYLNIDGVLLTKDQNQLAEHATEFIDFVVNHFDCYWLTTHCHGDVQEVMELLSECLDLDSLENIKKIKPTKWNILKTEAINIKDDFYWLDDSPLQTEIIFLKKNKVIDRLITVNLNHEGELNKILNDPLKKIINNTLLKENSTKDNIFKKTVFKNDNFEITLKLNILKGKVEDMPEGKEKERAKERSARLKALSENSKERRKRFDEYFKNNFDQCQERIQILKDCKYQNIPLTLDSLLRMPEYDFLMCCEHLKNKNYNLFFSIINDFMDNDPLNI